jgi:hypothetical protein
MVGYVIRCNHCNQLQVAYGTVIVSIIVDDYSEFCYKIQQLCVQHPVSDHPNLKKIAVNTPYVGLMLYLSERELSELADMLDVADTKLKSDELLQLFSA